MRITLTGALLHLSDTGRTESRPLADTDQTRFADWAARYDSQIRANASDDLISIGRDLFAWLDGPAHWLASFAQGNGPRILEPSVETQPDDLARVFLDLPWELLADKAGFLAGDIERPLLLARRLGSPVSPAPPRHRDLLLLFMAAQPEGETVLDYEAEEAGILDATAPLDLHLRVEESGCLPYLEQRLREGDPVEALHLSCHGTIEDNEPVLALETPEGRRHIVGVPDLLGALGADKPPLLFLSACRTAEQPSAALSLVLRMVRAGVSNVIGWDGSVYDSDAAAFARTFYKALIGSASPYAAAMARQDLLREHLADPRRGRHWHLARVFMGPAGGGPLCHSSQPGRAWPKEIG